MTMSTTIAKLASRFLLAPTLLLVLVPATASAQATCRDTYSGLAPCINEDGLPGAIASGRTYSPWIQGVITYDIYTGELCGQTQPLPFDSTVCHNDFPADPVVVGL